MSERESKRSKEEPKKKPSTSREDVLKVSCQLFADEGYDGVSMRRIANAAGVSITSIYHFFSNKKELFLAVEDQLFTEHATSLLEALHSGATPEQRLHNFIRQLMVSFEAHPRYFKILQRSLMDGRYCEKAVLQKAFQNVYLELKQMLNDLAPNSGEGAIPVLIFASVIGNETIRPAAQLLENYPYAQASRDEEQKLLADNVLAMIKSM